MACTALREHRSSSGGRNRGNGGCLNAQKLHVKMEISTISN